MINQYIISGNLVEYQNYCEKQGAVDVGSSYVTPSHVISETVRYLYVKDAMRLMGVHEPRGKLIGTWYHRQDINDILTQLVIANSITVNKRREILETRNKILAAYQPS